MAFPKYEGEKKEKNSDIIFLGGWVPQPPLKNWILKKLFLDPVLPVVLAHPAELLPLSVHGRSTDLPDAEHMQYAVVC